MAQATQQIWLNGKLVNREQAVVGVYDHGLLYGDGVFEGIRCYNGRIFKMATHLRRLFDSARSIRLTVPYTAEQLGAAMRETVAARGQPDSYIRLVVTRGEGALGIGPDRCRTPNVFIIADSIALYPAKVYQEGMAVITAATMRNHPAALSPRIKSLNYLNNIMAKLEALDAGVPEAVMLNHLGFVAECTADNLFIVRQSDSKPVLMTPPLHAGGLEGVTMNAVIELAVQAGITVERPDLTKHDLYTADEMFLTGTGAEVIAVTKIDGRTVGCGQPGTVTLQLTEAFRKLVAANAPED